MSTLAKPRNLPACALGCALAIAVLAPSAAHAGGFGPGPVAISVDGGAAVPTFGNLAPNLALGVEASVPLGTQVAVGLTFGSSVHAVGQTVDTAEIDHLALLGSWRLDLTPIVPVVRLAVGALRIVSPDGSAAFYPDYELGLALDYWPTAPLSGFGIGFEVRYLGALAGGQVVFPVMSVYGVRCSYGF